MKPLTHAQARRALLAAADHLLGAAERTQLEDHLRVCATCRADAESLNGLDAKLRQAFHSRWDTIPAPERPLLHELPAPEGLFPRLGRSAANLLLLALWLWLYRAVFGYLRIIFTHEEFRTNQIVLLGGLLLIFSQVRQTRFRIHFDTLPHLHSLALVLTLGGSAAYLAAERFLDINTLSASLFALASYGLLGLWLSPRRWQAGLPAALLLIGTLPFGEHLQTFVGYPMRMATATIVRDMLSALGVPSIGVDTILVFESGLAQVDIPCSGVKSLWTGMLFLLAVTWLERRAINLRWLGVAALTGGLLFAVNVARVGALVMVGEVAHWELVARMIHVPLGILGFVVVCGAIVLLLREKEHVPSLSLRHPLAEDEPRELHPRPLWLAPSLAVMIAGMSLLYTPRPTLANAQAVVSWVFPAAMNAQTDPLSPGFYAWVMEGGAESAERWRFKWTQDGASLEGTFVFITSLDWRAQHRPERCFETDGLTVNASQVYLVAPDFPLQFLSLSKNGVQTTAIYWLQAGNRVTNEYATRIWADLAPQRQRWVLVTILFDRVYPPDEAGIKAFVGALRAVVAHGLEGELP